jgi:hypothetical protein
MSRGYIYKQGTRYKVQGTRHRAKGQWQKVEALRFRNSESGQRQMAKGSRFKANGQWLRKKRLVNERF